MSKKLLGTHLVPSNAKFVIKPAATPATAGTNNATGDQLVFALASDGSLYRGAQLKTDHIENNAVTLPKLAHHTARGMMHYAGSDFAPTALGAGNALEVPMSNGAGSDITMQRVKIALQVQNDGTDVSRSGSDMVQNDDASSPGSSNILKINAGEGLDVSLSGAVFSLSAESSTEDQAFTADSSIQLSVSDIASPTSWSSNPSSIVLTDSSSVKAKADNDFGSDFTSGTDKHLKISASGGAYRIFLVTAKSTDTNEVTLSVSLVESSGSMSSPSGLEIASGSSNIRIPGNIGSSTYRSSDFSVSSALVSLLAAQTNITSMRNNSLVVGRASGSDEINFGTDGQIQLKTNSASRLVAKDAGVDITGQLDVVGSVGISQNLVVQGDLVVDGDTIEVVGENVQMKDTLMELGMQDDGSDGLIAPTVDAGKDLGLVFHRGAQSTSFGAVSGVSGSAVSGSLSASSTTSITFGSLSGLSSTILAGTRVKFTSSAGFMVFKLNADLTSSGGSISVTHDPSSAFGSQQSSLSPSYSAIEFAGASAAIDAFFLDASDSKFKLRRGVTQSNGEITGLGSAGDLAVGAAEASSLSVSGDSDIAGLSMTGKLDTYAGSAPAAGKLLMGDGTDFEYGDISAGVGIDVAYASNAITVTVEKAAVSSKLLHCKFGADGKLDAVYKDSADHSLSTLVANGNSSAEFSGGSSPIGGSFSADRSTTSLALASSHGLSIADGDLIQVLFGAGSGAAGYEYIATESAGSSSVSVQYVQDVGAPGGTAITPSRDAASGSDQHTAKILKGAAATLGGVSMDSDDLKILLDNSVWFGADAPGLAYRADVDRLVPDTASSGAVSTIWEQDSAGVTKKSNILLIDLTGAGDSDDATMKKYVTFRVQVMKYLYETQ